jgi:hypothetical protein
MSCDVPTFTEAALYIPWLGSRSPHVIFGSRSGFTTSSQPTLAQA